MSAYSSEEAFERLMDDLQVIYSAKAGQTLTQDDVDALNRLDTHWRDEEEKATDAYHRGWKDALASAGQADFARMDEKVSEATVNASVERAMASMARTQANHFEKALRDIDAASREGGSALDRYTRIKSIARAALQEPQP